MSIFATKKDSEENANVSFAPYWISYSFMQQVTTKICSLKQHTILSQFLWSPGMAESSEPGFLTRLELKESARTKNSS